MKYASKPRAELGVRSISIYRSATNPAGWTAIGRYIQSACNALLAHALQELGATKHVLFTVMTDGWSSAVREQKFRRSVEWTPVNIIDARDLLCAVDTWWSSRGDKNVNALIALNVLKAERICAWCCCCKRGAWYYVSGKARTILKETESRRISYPAGIGEIAKTYSLTVSLNILEKSWISCRRLRSRKKQFRQSSWRHGGLCATVSRWKIFRQKGSQYYSRMKKASPSKRSSGKILIHSRLPRICRRRRQCAFGVDDKNISRRYRFMQISFISANSNSRKILS